MCPRCAKGSSKVGIVQLLFMNKTPAASLHKLAAGRKLAATHLNVSNRQMCGCTGFKSGTNCNNECLEDCFTIGYFNNYLSTIKLNTR